MNYAELSNEQRRQLIDAQQAFAAWRPAASELDRLGTLRAQATLLATEYVATGDADLLWDTKQSLLLAATGVRQMKRRPSVFISCSWDSAAHKRWVRQLAERLIKNG
jgi:hypothetical protein